MASEWRTARIEEVAERVGMGPFGSSIKVSTFVPDGIPVISGQHLHGTRLRDTTFNFVSPEHADKLRSANVYRGDVVFTHAGNIGQAAYIPGTSKYERYVLSQRQFFLRCDRTKLLPEFAAYFFSTAEGQHRLLANASQVGVPSIARPVTYLRTIEIPLPPLPEQRAIANILGTLDDKIELNRRTNQTLEAIARALFKSWFVDFDPVRAKSEGRDPGLPPHFADLFPDTFEDSELGEIPKGWEVGSLDSVLVLQRGFDLPAPQRTSGAYPVLAASGPSGSHNEFMVRGPGVTTGRSGVLGKVFFVHDDFWPLNTSLWVKEFRHSRPAYAFHLLRGLDLALFNAGSAVPTLNRNHVHGLPTLLPPMVLIDAFERAATMSLQRQRHNDRQSSTLAAVRELLLPKLISGQLRVRHAERIAVRAEA
jgi:Restriction endonuclease S subunits